MNDCNTQLLSGKKGIVVGVANDMSIAWSIASIASKHGANIGLTYPNEAIQRRVDSLSEFINCDFTAQCDVTNSDSMDKLFELVKAKWGKLDFFVHSIAFADRNELKGKFFDTTLANFQNSMHISCYSLIDFAKRLQPIMNENASIITMTYYGAEKVIPSYNVMGVAKAALESSVKYLAEDLGEYGIRVNAISAGPIKTLAASGISNFSSMLKIHAKTSPLRRNVTQEDVAGGALYLLSPLSSGVTGEIHYIDCGYNVLGICSV
ncbi:MAG: enoyl-ACP reductase [Rickettsiaceae bacterium]